MFPISTVPRLRDVLARQLARTESVEKATDRIIRWLFHRNGKPINRSAVRGSPRAKTPTSPVSIPHDFRRTAIRNLERAGIPRSAAMAMVGHKTESVYRRYAIVEEGMLNEAGVKLQTFYDNAKAGPSSVVRFPRARVRRGREGGTGMVQVWGKSEGLRELVLKHRSSEVLGRTQKKMVGREGIGDSACPGTGKRHLRRASLLR